MVRSDGPGLGDRPDGGREDGNSGPEEERFEFRIVGRWGPDEITPIIDSAGLVVCGEINGSFPDTAEAILDATQDFLDLDADLSA